MVKFAQVSSNVTIIADQLREQTPEYPVGISVASSRRWEAPATSSRKRSRGSPEGP